jgi:hypothetical protein
MDYQDRYTFAPTSKGAWTAADYEAPVMSGA